MNIPKQIKIGGLTYRVDIVENIEDGVVGKIYYKDLVIKVEKSNVDFMALTFWHEVFHAMNSQLDHVSVEFFAQSVTQLLKDNPALFAKEEVPAKPKKKPKKGRG